MVRINEKGVKELADFLGHRIVVHRKQIDDFLQHINIFQIVDGHGRVL